MATFYLDFEGGNDANDGTSYANRWKTIASGATAARIAPGDTIRMMSSLDPTSLGNATWTNASNTVTLADSTITKIIDDGENAWTDRSGGNVTCNTSGTYVENSQSASFNVAAGFTTGIMASKSFAARDYSAYQQINLLIRTATTIASGVLQIALCSDTAGATPVNTFTINMAINPTGYWHKIVIDNGSALGASIQSVALYALSDPGTVTYLLIDNIFCSKAPTAADCLTLNSLIRLTSASGNDGHWYNVTSVNGATVKIGGLANDNGPTSNRGYYGTTATTQPTQVRQCIALTPVTSDSAALNAIQDAGGGSSGYITFSGGWNRTDMSTQTGYTCLLSPNGKGYMWDFAAQKDYIAIEYCMAVNSYWGFRNWGNYHNYTNCHAINCIQYGFFSGVSNASARATLTGCYGTACGTGFYFDGNNTGGNVFNDCHADACRFQAGFDVRSNGPLFRNCSARGNVGYGWTWQSGGTTNYQDMMVNCTTASNSTGGIKNNINGSLRIKNCLISDSTEFTTLSNVSDLSAIISTDHDQVAGDVKHFNTLAYTIATATDQRHTASGLAWKFSPLVNFTSNFPLKLRLGIYRVTANTLFTVTCWGRKDTASTNVVICCPGGQVTGVSNDVTSSSVSATSTWEQLSLTATPTANGVVEIWGYFYGTSTVPLTSSTHCWFDDMGFT